MSKIEKILLAVNFALWGFLTTFSYAYVDLNLTLSRAQIFLSFVSLLQQLGYYNRTLSTIIYLIFIIIVFIFFILNLWLFYKSKVGITYLRWLVATSTVILIFAYPLLSSDLFNYLFDAKIILKYHTSPYTHRALDFPQDDWIRFMRWIHRYSPYGPLWLAMSLVPAILGFGKFILNFLAFKIFIGSFHLINSYLIFKILQKMQTKQILFQTAFYALNPLFVIEGIANAHNDIVLIAFTLLAVYFMVNGKITKSYSSLILGALTKYITLLLLPIFVKFGKEKRDHWLIFSSVLIMALFTYIYSTFKITVPFVPGGSTQVQFQPWYLFWTIPLVSFLPNLNMIAFAISILFGASLRYLPYLLYGDWSHAGTIQFMQSVTIIPPVLVLVIILLKNKLRNV